MDSNARRKRGAKDGKPLKKTNRKRFQVGDLLLTRHQPFGETEPEIVLGMIMFVGNTLYRVQWFGFEATESELQNYGDYAIRLFRRAYQEYRAEYIDG